MRGVPLGVPVAVTAGLLMMAGAAHAATSSNDTLSIQLMILGLCVTPVIYFLPSVFAATRDHPSANGVFAVNLLLGWTVVGWVVAMVWVFMAKNRAVKSVPPSVAPPSTMAVSIAPVLSLVDIAAQEIEDLTRQKLQLQISDDEYNQRKKAILDRWKADAVPTAMARP